MTTLQLGLFELSPKTQIQMEMFDHDHKADIGKRMKLDLKARIKLLKECMQTRDRIKHVSTKDRVEINRLVNKLDLDGLLKIETLKKYH